MLRPLSLPHVVGEGFLGLEVVLKYVLNCGSQRPTYIYRGSCDRHTEIMLDTAQFHECGAVGMLFYLVIATPTERNIDHLFVLQQFLKGCQILHLVQNDIYFHVKSGLVCVPKQSRISRSVQNNYQTLVIYFARRLEQLPKTSSNICSFGWYHSQNVVGY